MASSISGAGFHRPLLRPDEDGAETTTGPPGVRRFDDLGAERVGGSARPRLPTRHPRVLRLLGMLRGELARIARAPTSPESAHREIVEAMTRAMLDGWSLPALDAPANRLHADGSIAIPLVAHVVVINPWGAFRILDCLRPRTIYFEMAGADDRAFAPPWRASDEASPSFAALVGCHVKPP